MIDRTQLIELLTAPTTCGLTAAELADRILALDETRPRADPHAVAEHAKARAKRKREKYRTETEATATRRHQEWTGAELELLARAGHDLTYKQVALMTGRTYSAVTGMKHKLTHEPRLRRTQ